MTSIVSRTSNPAGWALFALIAALLSVMGPASAQVPAADLEYTLSGDDPTLATPVGADGNPCVADATAGTFAYSVAQIRVDTSGAYSFDDVGAGDGLLAFYGGAFSPSDLANGCLAVFDAATATSTVTLAAGTTYTLVRSTGTSETTGSFGFATNGPGTLTVLTPTTTILNSAPKPSKLGKPVTLTAQVQGGTPSGAVQFRDGGTLVGSASVSGGIATLVVSSLKLGGHTLTASYLGDGTTTSSTGTTTHRVKRGRKPRVTLKVSAKQVAVGRKVKLTWTTKRADKVRAGGAWSGRRTAKGSKKVKVKKLGPHIYKLKAININGVAKARVKVVAVRGAKKFDVSVPTDIVQNDSDLLVRSSGFDSKERFKVFLDDKLLIKGFATKGGRVRTLAPIPKSATEGEHVLSVVGSRPNRRGEVDILVVRPKQLDLEVEESPIPAKTNQTVTVSGLVAGETVTLLLDGQSLTEGVADATGTFTHTFAVGKKTGIRTLEAVGQIAARNGEVTFEVEKTVIG